MLSLVTPKTIFSVIQAREVPLSLETGLPKVREREWAKFDANRRTVERDGRTTDLAGGRWFHCLPFVRSSSLVLPAHVPTAYISRTPLRSVFGVLIMGRGPTPGGGP